MPVDINEGPSNISAGGGGTDGDVVLRDGDGRGLIHLDTQDANPFPFGDGDEVRVFVDGWNGTVRLGSNGADGRLRVVDADGADVSEVTPSRVSTVGTLSATDGRLAGTSDDPAFLILSQTGDPSGAGVLMNSEGILALGARDLPGTLRLDDASTGTTRVELLGGQRRPLGPNVDRLRIVADGDQADFVVGGGASDAGDPDRDVGRDGTVAVTDADGERTVELDGAESAVVLRAPNGDRYRLTVINRGNLRTTEL